jgi:hypothetical protein
MTYQPPGGAPPEPTPYAQPQDPWAGGHEPGVAAAPTDPIPQQPFGAGQYAPGVASPSVWTQETMSQGGPYGYAPSQPKSRIGVYLLVFLAIIVLGGGGGFGAYYVITHRGGTGNNPQGQGTPTTQVNPSNNASTPAASPTLDPATVKVNDCLFNSSQDDDNPTMQVVQCGKPGSYKVLKIASGASIPEAPNGKFDRDHTSVAVCAGTDYRAWYAWDSEDNNKDYFFCLSAKSS